MAADLAARLERMASGDYRPTTLLERGVVVPFTTPLLLGAKLRPSARKGLELVITNISGGRGFYIVSWSSLAEICAPSLHDERLFALLSARAALSPGDIRRASRQVAQEGWGGRHAAKAAVQAEAEAALDRARLNLGLLKRLVGQTEAPAEAAVPITQDTPDQQQHRAKRAVLHVAESLGLQPEDAIQSLEGIALAFQEVGVQEEPVASRQRRLLAAIDAIAREIGAWVAETPAAQETHAGEMIAVSCNLTLRCGAAMLGRIDAGFADLPRLLRRWRAEPETVATEAARLDWLLDGWPLILGLWEQAEPPEQLRAIWEVAMLLPVLPRETAAWCSVEADWDLPQRLRRLVKARHERRSCRPVDLSARNERLMVGAL